MFRLLSVFPWVFVGSLGLMIVMEFGGEYPSWTTIAQIGYVGVCAVAWFAFLRRYPFVVTPYKYGDDEWRRLTSSSGRKRIP